MAPSPEFINGICDPNKCTWLLMVNCLQMMATAPQTGKGGSVVVGSGSELSFGNC
jgi:hypothetical protein